MSRYRIQEYVRWEDIDAAGIINYQAYLRFFALAEAELLGALRSRRAQPRLTAYVLEGMPRGKDWLELIRSTFHSVGRAEMSGLYAREWRHAKEKLTAEERDEIDREPKRIKRFLKSANAVLFGLSRRLAPARRVAFGAALLLTLLSFQ